MSRMTPPVDLTTHRTARGALDAPMVQPANQALAIVAVADEMRKLRQDMETRWQAIEAYVNALSGGMDSILTGLHQDVANLFLRYQAQTTWLMHQFPSYETDMQALMTQMIADMNAEAAKVAAEQETTPDAEQSADQDHLSIQAD